MQVRASHRRRANSAPPARARTANSNTRPKASSVSLFATISTLFSCLNFLSSSACSVGSGWSDLNCACDQRDFLQVRRQVHARRLPVHSSTLTEGQSFANRFRNRCKAETQWFRSTVADEQEQ